MTPNKKRPKQRARQYYDPGTTKMELGPKKLSALQFNPNTSTTHVAVETRQQRRAARRKAT